MDLRRALHIINIEEILEIKKKEGTQLICRGLIEGSKDLAEALVTIKEFLRGHNE